MPDGRGDVNGGHAALHALRADWQRLAGTSADLLTQAPDWMLTATLLPATGRPLVETVVRDGALVGVAAMSPNRGRLGIIGADTVWEPVDLLAADDDARDELCRRLLARGRPVVLRHLPAASPTRASLGRALGSRGRALGQAESGSPFLDLDERWTELGGGLSSRRRSDLRRAVRRAEQLGEVRVRLLRPTPEEAPGLVAEALAVEATGWKGLAGTALLDDPVRLPFYRAYADRLAASGALLLAFLDIDGRAAAMQVAAVWGERVWLLKIGYDPAFRQASPGLVLLAHVVQHAATERLAGVEFLGDDEDWLAPWTSGVRERVSLVAVPASVRALPGVVTLAAPRAREAVARTGGDWAQTVVDRLRSSFVTGPTLADAMAVEQSFATRGRPTILGFWHAEDDTPATIHEQYAACILALAGRPDAQVSLKPSGLGTEAEVLRRLLEQARDTGVGLHLDAVGAEWQDVALAAVGLLAPASDGRLGCTLPGRWSRSDADAESVGTLGVPVRVVKGESPPADAPDRDRARGFLEVVSALCAARPPLVQLATHDAPLLEEALCQLAAAGVRAEHQVLWGMHSQASVRVAVRRGVTTRVFVPYGVGRVPFPLRETVRRPEYAGRLVRDLVSRPSAF